MLYVEAVLYVTIALSAFGLGYLAGRGGWRAVATEDADVQRVAVEGKVLLLLCTGAEQGDEAAVVIVLPADKSPTRRLPIAGLQPSDPPPIAGDATSAALAELGGGAVRTDASGNFKLFVPAVGSYRILVILPHAAAKPAEPFEQPDSSELGRYFDIPADLLKGCSCGWCKTDLRHEAPSRINVAFRE